MVVVSAVQVTVLQILLSVPATVFNVLGLVQQLAVQQTPIYVVVIVVFVMVQVQHITVQEAMVFVQILLLHVDVQVVAQCLIVRPVLLIHMVYAVIRHVATILVRRHMITGYVAQLVIIVQTVVVQPIMPPATMVVVVQPLITDVMAPGHAPLLTQAKRWYTLAVRTLIRP